MHIIQDRVGGDKGAAGGGGGGGGQGGGAKGSYPNTQTTSWTNDGSNREVVATHNGLNMGYNVATAQHVPQGGWGGGQGGGGNDPSNTAISTAKLYVGNLSWDAAWQDLKDHFRTCGNVQRADVITEPNGRSKGFGVVGTL